MGDAPSQLAYLASWAQSARASLEWATAVWEQRALLIEALPHLPRVPPDSSRSSPHPVQFKLKNAHLLPPPSPFRRAWVELVKLLRCCRFNLPTPCCRPRSSQHPLRLFQTFCMLLRWRVFLVCFSSSMSSCSLRWGQFYQHVNGSRGGRPCTATRLSLRWLAVFGCRCGFSFWRHGK